MTDAIATFEVKIAPELETFVRPLTDATRHPDNFRKHKLDKIAQSLRTHGQRHAIVVQKSTGFIVAGNGRHEAAELLGWDRLAQIWQEMTDDEALAFLAIDNKTSDHASYDRARTLKALEKIAQGPGLFDAGWTLEEQEELIEQEAGVTTLAPTGGPVAEHVRDSPKFGEESKPGAAPVERMKEIPLIFNAKDHAAFVEQLKALAKLYKTSGTIATIVEAVRRQSEAEAGTPLVGSDEDAAYAVRRALVKEIRDYVLTMGDRSFSGTWLVAQLEKMVPFRPLKDDPQPVAGQVEAFPATGDATGVTITDDGTAVSPGPAIPMQLDPSVGIVPPEAPVTVDPGQPVESLPAEAVAVPDDDDSNDAEALEMLARIRAGKPS